MEARRREPERHEQGERHEERERRGERLEPVQRERYLYEAETAEVPARVDWSAVWAGLISGLATLAILSALVIAVGWAAGGGTSTIVWSIIITLIAFCVGGYVSGATSAYQGRTEAFILGSMVWALGASFALLLIAIAAGGLFAATTAGTAPAGLNTQPVAVGVLVALVVTYVGSVVGAMVGCGSHREIETR